MKLSKELHKISKLVYHILKEDPFTRNSDSYLYLKVLLYVGKQKEINVKEMSIESFLIRRKELNLPSYKSVCRARRKVQAAHPELKCNAAVEEQKILNEMVYKNYARSR